jgi:molybdenum cofactor biosynthesis enzyme MoaA
MLLQLENTNKDNIDKLLAFAKQNHLQLSLIDDVENNFLMPGKPLTSEELTKLIEKSRASGIVSMKNAHQIIRDTYNAS